MKIDWFNKNKIKRLEDEVERLWANNANRDQRLAQIDKRLENTPLFAYIDNNLEGIVLRIKAIQEFLDVEFNDDYIDDPYREPVKQPKVRILKAVKRTKHG